MATQSVRRAWSYADFAALPDDGNRYEVIDGELFVTPSPRLDHQDVVSAFVEVMRPFARAHGLGKVYGGPVDVLFAEGDYLAPDLVFLSTARLHYRSRRGIEGPPDLVLEVLSPRTASRDRTLKRERYALYGVREYWIVDADSRRVEVYRPGEARPRIASDRLEWRPVEDGPALHIDLEALFAEIDT